MYEDRVRAISQVLIDHSYDYLARECMCGYSNPRLGGLAIHVAVQIEQVINPAGEVDQ